MQGSIAWDDLRFLLAAVRDGSFAAAARRLRVDPATVGRRLRALQLAVGAPLLERSPGRLSLTAAGERALRAAEQMDAAALHLERVVDAGLPAVEGVLRIGATEGLADRVVAPRLPELLARHPALHLELVTSNEAANLSRREADVAVRLFRPAEPALAARRAGLLAFGLYASAGYLGRRGRPAGPRLEGHDLLGYEPGLATRSGALGWADELGGRVVLRATSAGALLAAAAAGAGIGLLPCFLADREPDLARVLPALRTRELWLVVHGDLRRTARARAGLDFLAQVLADAAPLLRGDRPADLPGPARRGGRNFTLGD
jgi:DNA-binding transcriptional LysR family regulator